MSHSVNKPESKTVIDVSSDSSTSYDETSPRSERHERSNLSKALTKVVRIFKNCRDEATSGSQTKKQEPLPSSSSSSDNFETGSPETPRGSSGAYPSFKPDEENWEDYLQRTNFDHERSWTETSIKSLLKSSIKWDAEKEILKKELTKEKKLRRKMQKELNELKKFVHHNVNPKGPLGPEESSSVPQRNRQW